jgi:hypothetical protein
MDSKKIQTIMEWRKPKLVRDANFSLVIQTSVDVLSKNIQRLLIR